MIELKFLGTKGEIEESSKIHQYHSSMLIIQDNFRLLIDYGELHKYELSKIKPDAILITHAHPDHYIWTKKDYITNIPIYMTKKTFDYGKFKPNNPKIIKEEKLFHIGPFKILGYNVIHSIRCPAVGFKIFVDKKKLVYNPDLIDIINKERILNKVDYYIGDGSCIMANLVRKKGEKLFGHTRITTQINWCKEKGIKNILFTHLGKETLRKEKQFLREHPEIRLAYDEMELIL